MFHRILMLSTMTDGEYVTLVSTFISHTNERLNCGLQKSRLNGRGDISAALAEIERRSGCKADGSKQLFQLGKISFRKCLCNFQNTQLPFLLKLHKHFEAGVMPFEGPLADQPAKLMDVFGLLDELKEDYRQAQEKAEATLNKQSQSRRRQ